MNGLQHSPQQQLQSLCSAQQSKLSQNGLKSSLRYSTQPSVNTAPSNQISNGRKIPNLDTQIDKNLDNDNMEKSMPVFAKPFKIPSQPDYQISKNRPMNLSERTSTSSHADGGKDVESILKMMTSTLEPLTKIAATPRTDIDVQTPNKSYVYANLPPLLRATTINCNNSKHIF